MMAQSAMHRIDGRLDAGTESCSLGVHDNNSLEEQTAQIELLLLNGELSSLLGCLCTRLVHPQKNFHLLMEIAFQLT